MIVIAMRKKVINFLYKNFLKIYLINFFLAQKKDSLKKKDSSRGSSNGDRKPGSRRGRGGQSDREMSESIPHFLNNILIFFSRFIFKILY